MVGVGGKWGASLVLNPLSRGVVDTIPCKRLCRRIAAWPGVLRASRLTAQPIGCRDRVG